MAEGRVNRTPSLIVSALLHAGALGAGLVAWPWLDKTTPVTMTPVTLLTSAELAELMSAQQSPEPQEAQAEEPVPEAPPEPVAEAPAPVPQPAPRPTPSPPTPTPAPKAPAPTPAQKAPAPKAAPPTKAAPTNAPRLDLDALAKSLADSTKRPGGGPTSAAKKGPARAESDLMERLSQGEARAATASAIAAIVNKVGRLWNPNCEVESAADIRVRVRFILNPDGSINGRPQLVDHPNVDAIADPVLKASASRALSAVARGSPYEGLPREDYNSWREVRLNFIARDVCRGR